MVQDSALPFQGAQVPGQGTKIPKDVQHSQKKKKSIYLLKYLNIMCVCVYIYKTILKVHSN